MKKWIKEFKPKTVAFKDLPRSHQLAIIHYMAVDGEAWSLEGALRNANIDLHYERWHYSRWQRQVKILLGKSLPVYIKKHGRRKFGVVDIPTAVLGEMTLKSNPVCKEYGWKSLEEIHKWYCRNFDIPKHSNKNRWPCIISSFDDEVLQDGHHRFHRYIQQGAKKIPCVFYVD